METLRQKSNLSHRVTQELGRAIVCGEIRTSETFPTEAELCGQFGVSRTAVREAVKMLSAKGLVSSKPRKGIRILPEELWNIFDPDLLQWSLEGTLTRPVLKEFFQMRVAIEPEAAALGAQNARPELLAPIAEALDRMHAAPAESEASRLADIEFHIAILYATENRFYVRMRDFIRTALNISIRFTTPGSTEYAAALNAHADVYQAMSRGDADTARRCMRRLIDEAAAFL